jgi:hypothetical protein
MSSARPTAVLAPLRVEPHIAHPETNETPSELTSFGGVSRLLLAGAGGLGCPFGRPHRQEPPP